MSAEKNIPHDTVVEAPTLTVQQSADRSDGDSASSTKDEKRHQGEDTQVTNYNKYNDGDADSLGLGEGLEITMLGPAPTDEERKTLRKMPAKIPYLALLIALLELCERASYYGLTGELRRFWFGIPSASH